MPAIDWMGSIQLIKARGVNYTAYTEAWRVPVEAAAGFPEMTKRALKAHPKRQQEVVVPACVLPLAARGQPDSDEDGVSSSIRCEGDSEDRA